MRNNLWLVLFFAFLTSISGQTELRDWKKHRKTQRKALISKRGPLEGKIFPSIPYFDYNPEFSVHAEVVAIENEDGSLVGKKGDKRNYRAKELLIFFFDNEEFRLTAYRLPKYEHMLFIPFTDQTTDQSTYGGGRYIELDDRDIVGNKITLDFNKCYHPYCVYREGYNCVVPPLKNDLDIEILAGECLDKSYARQVRRSRKARKK